MSSSFSKLLMERGFFPEILPPCFSATELANLTETHANTLSDMRWQGKMTAKTAFYSGTKRTGHRRQFATCNPAIYHYIANFIEDQWGLFEDHFRKSNISLTIPSFQDKHDSNRSIFITPFNQLDRLVHEKISYAPYLVRTDIAQFFPSLYTHSIPWAIHGKSQSKVDFSPKSTTLPFNELDFQVRRSQDGQTRGLPVGPDAYRIIAELVAVAADHKLHEKSNSKIIGGVRHVDDYYIGVADESNAALVLTHLREALAEFELFLNDEKTHIIRTDISTGERWPTELRAKINNVGYLSTPEAIRTSCEDTIRYVTEHKNQSPLKLLLRTIDQNKIHEINDFSILENYLLRFVHHFPHALDYVCLLAAKRQSLIGDCNLDSWRSVINTNLKRFAS